MVLPCRFFMLRIRLGVLGSCQSLAEETGDYAQYIYNSHTHDLSVYCEYNIVFINEIITKRTFAGRIAGAFMLWRICG